MAQRNDRDLDARDTRHTPLSLIADFLLVVDFAKLNDVSSSMFGVRNGDSSGLCMQAAHVTVSPTDHGVDDLQRLASRLCMVICFTDRVAKAALSVILYDFSSRRSDVING